MKAFKNADGTYTVIRRGGFLWLKKFRAIAHYHYGWYWPNGDDIDNVSDLDVRIALWDARSKEESKYRPPVWEEVL